MTDLRPQEWIADLFIPHSGSCVVIGERRSYKTSLAIDTALSVATGTPILDVVATWRGPVRLLFGERHGDQLRKQFHATRTIRGYTEDAPVKLAVLYNDDHTLDAYDCILDCVGEIGDVFENTLVVIDEISDAFASEPSARQVAELLRRLHRMDCAILIFVPSRFVPDEPAFGSIAEAVDVVATLADGSLNVVENRLGMAGLKLDMCCEFVAAGEGALRQTTIPLLRAVEVSGVSEDAPLPLQPDRVSNDQIAAMGLPELARNALADDADPRFDAEIERRRSLRQPVQN